MQMDQFEPTQILETRLFDLGSTPVDESPTQDANQFLTDLAASQPTPGGGSASAYSAAMGASLVAMVGRLTVGKKRYADVESQMWPIIEEATELMTELQTAVVKDAEAFDAYMEARRLPRDTESQKLERNAAIQAASIKAAEVPLSVAKKAERVMALALKTAEMGNLNAISDAGTGVALAKAAIKGAGLNVRINLLGMEDEPQPETMLKTLKEIEGHAAQLAVETNQVLTARGGLDLS
jgi:glutamate formiminotransferase/formiminotetrahydrofolate cyclodeaminase